MSTTTLSRDTIAEEFRHIQDEICTALENYDEKGIFREDHWKRPGGGGGRTRIFENANLLEKGGVNFSAVHGKLPEKIATGLKIKAETFFATGVSIVLHPFNPWVPIIHMNIRYFEMDKHTWWFGGGIDLTPHYIDEKQAAEFHLLLKNTCDRYNIAFYPRFKQWADDYFYLPHRNETRGVGGIFFDRLNKSEGSKDNLFEFVSGVGRTFFPAYKQQLDLNKDKVYGPRELEWQNHRRGRYVEFNLVYDKGTKFGLQTDGRIESILMSLPPVAMWSYAHEPKDDPQAEKTQLLLKKGVSWI